ncbi:MAG TPA: hypothetical protein DD671_14715, partial [Balneolaceae bacterium]|nr:hypothetical protein [Balneolaceae bacterium]
TNSVGRSISGINSIDRRSSAMPPKMSTARTKITEAMGFLSSKWRILDYLEEDSKINWDMETMGLVVWGFLG